LDHYERFELIDETELDATKDENGHVIKKTNKLRSECSRLNGIGVGMSWMKKMSWISLQKVCAERKARTNWKSDRPMKIVRGQLLGILILQILIHSLAEVI